MTRIVDRRRPRAERGAVRHEDGTSEVFRRLGSAEGDIRQLSEDFIGVSAKLDSQGGQLKHIESQLSALVNSMQARSVTDWKSLAAWASVILAVVALYTNLNLTPLKEGIVEGKTDRADLRSEIRTLSNAQTRSITEMVDTAEKRGRMMERLDNIEERQDRMGGN